MKKLFTLFIAVLLSATAIAQTTPTIKTRSDASFQQSDAYLIALNRLGIPTGPSDNLVGSSTAANTVKLFFNTTTNKLRVYNPVSATWADASPFSSTGFINNNSTGTPQTANLYITGYGYFEGQVEGDNLHAINYAFIGNQASADIGLWITKSKNAAVARGLRIELDHTGGAGTPASTGIDVINKTSGTQNFDHTVGVQIRPEFNSSGNIIEFTGTDIYMNNNAGHALQTTGILIRNPNGTGLIDDLYGIYIQEQNRGTNKNYAIYTAGLAQSYFGGNTTFENQIENNSQYIWSRNKGLRVLSLGASANQYGGIGYNVFFNTTNEHTRLISDYSSMLYFNDGGFDFRIGGNGAASSTITWTNAMTIDKFGKINTIGDLDIGGTATIANYLYVGSGLTSSQIYSTLDTEVTTVGYGFVVKSPNGSRWRIGVSNVGVVTATSL